MGNSGRAASVMTPKERILAALRRQEVDYAPCVPLWWESPRVDGYRWTSNEERLEVNLNRLGVDALLYFFPPNPRAPQANSRTWVEQVPGEHYPHLHKVIETPAGELTCTVRQTEDWEHGEDIPLVSDFVVSRIVKPWIETERDLACLEYLWQPPADVTEQELATALAPVRALADRYQVPIQCHVGMGLTASLSLFGAQQAALVSIEQPDLLDYMVELGHRQIMKNIELAARAGVDFLGRNGWYETTDFWSPAQIERLLGARHRAELALAHGAGLPMTYTVCTGVMPMIDYLQSQAFDCLVGIEPVLGDQDMAVIARALGPEKSFWSGVSAPIQIGRGSPESVRCAVRSFYEDFGKRGTLLAAVASIRPQWPWENVLAMFDEWRQCR
jgi:hypothetical protein